jgi:hypothetical protein
VTRVPAITAIINEAEATAAAPAAQPTCRRELDDCSKMPRKVAAKPPRNALRKAICLPISDKNSALIGGTVIYSGERRSHIGFRCTSESPAVGQRKALAKQPALRLLSQAEGRKSSAATERRSLERQRQREACDASNETKLSRGERERARLRERRVPTGASLPCWSSRPPPRRDRARRREFCPLPRTPSRSFRERAHT